MSTNFKVSIFVFGLCLAVAYLMYIAAKNVVHGVEENACDMTYMFQYPEYVKVNLKKTLSKNFPRYALYIYGEGHYADELKKFTPTGIPVLFIPGNAGSHRQVRSLASVALRKAETKKNHFNYFTVDFNEDLSGLYGGVLMDQANFVHSCLRHILRMYKGNKNAPDSVIVIGHSMGGLIARALYTLEGFQSRLVHLIITLGTPHVAPVISFDSHLRSFYFQVNNFWQSRIVNNVTVVSFAGGSRDMLVPASLYSLHHISPFDMRFSAATTAVPAVWLSIDHLALCWCKQLILAINRVLFDMIDGKINQITKNRTSQRHVLQQHFGYCDEDITCSKQISPDKNQKSPSPVINNLTVSVGQLYETSVSGKILLLTAYSQENIHFIIVTKDIKNIVIQSCTKLLDKTCVGASDFAFTTFPSSQGKVEFLHLSSEMLSRHSYVMVSSLKPKSHVALQFTAKHDINMVFSNFMMFSGSQIFASNSLLTNISLPMGGNPYNVFLITVKKVNCENGNKGIFSGKLHFSSWFHQDIYARPSHFHEFDIVLKVYPTKPISDLGSPQLHIWDLDKCSHEVIIQHQLTDTLGHTFKMCAPVIPQWIYFWIMVMLTIQVDEMSHKSIWLSVWSTVTSKKLLKFLPLLFVVASGAIKLSIFLLGELHHQSSCPLVISIFSYDWLLPSSFVILTAFVMLIFLNFILELMVLSFARFFCFSKVEKMQNQCISYFFLALSSLYGSGLLCLSFFCSSSATYLLTISVFLYSCKKTRESKLFLKETSNSIQCAVSNQRNLSQMLLIFLVVFSAQVSPAFIVWIKVLRTSWHLPSDPFFLFLILFTPNLICLLQGNFQRLPKYASWVIFAVWLVGFILCSLDKLPYIVVFILMAINCFDFCYKSEHVKKC